jgi:SAM-dependent methyltransferase
VYSGLNAGCGGHRLQGWLNVDADRSVSVDLVCDCSRLPFKDRAFERVYARDLIHHVRDPTRTIRELSRVSSGHVEIWESERYNPFMFLFMTLTGFTTHPHFSAKHFRRLFEGQSVAIDARNDLDHVVKVTRAYAPGVAGNTLVSLFRILSRVVPTYNVAVIRVAAHRGSPTGREPTQPV